MDRVLLLLSLLLVFQSCTDDPPDLVNEDYACHWVKIDMTSQVFSGSYYPCWDPEGPDNAQDATVAVEVEGDSAIFSLSNTSTNWDTTFKSEVVCNYYPREPFAKASLSFFPNETIWNSSYSPEYGTLEIWFTLNNCKDGRFLGSK